MRVLHLLAPPGAGLARCLAVLTPGDVLLLLDGASPAAEVLRTAAASGATVYRLRPEAADADASEDTGVAGVDFDGFVTLTAACDVSVAWN